MVHHVNNNKISRPGRPQAGQVGVQHTIIGKATLPHVFYLCIFGLEAKSLLNIYKGVGMTIFHLETF